MAGAISSLASSSWPVVVLPRREESSVKSFWRLFSVAFLVLAFLCTVAGCGGPKAEDPHSVLRSYSRALEEGRAEDAYRMLSEEARRGVSLEAFRRMVRDNPEEVREIARALSRPTATPVVTATVTTSTGQELQLVLENGK